VILENPEEKGCCSTIATGKKDGGGCEVIGQREGKSLQNPGLKSRSVCSSKNGHVDWKGRGKRSPSIEAKCRDRPLEEESKKTTFVSRLLIGAGVRKEEKGWSRGLHRQTVNHLNTAQPKKKNDEKSGDSTDP